MTPWYEQSFTPVGGDSGGEGGTTEPSQPGLVNGFEQADPFEGAVGATGNWSVETTTVYEGTQAVAMDAGQSNADILWPAKTGSETIQAGGHYQIFFQSSDLSGASPTVHFMVGGDPPADHTGYRVTLSSSGPLLLCRYDPGYGVIQDDNAQASQPIDTWIGFDIDLTDWPVITYGAIGADGTVAPTRSYDTTGDSNQYTSGGYGLGNDSGSAPIIFDSLRSV